MVNIRDIAKISGYSVSTVSRVINAHPYVEEQKRQKILQTMKELHYIPNATARKLSYGQTKNIGVILPYTDHPYFDQLVSGITYAAFESGYKVTLLPTNYQKEREDQYLREFAAKEFDGLIITSRTNALASLVEYQHYGPIVFCEQIDEQPVTSAYIDRNASFTEALVFLKEQGVDRIGATLGRSDKISYNSRITLELCKKIFPAFSEADVFWNCLNEKQGAKAAEFFKAREVEGIFTNSDLVAAGILQAYGEPLLRPLMIGRDNQLLSEILQFSTIDHQLTQCGETAFRLLLGEEIKQVKIPYRFIKRPSK